MNILIILPNDALGGAEQYLKMVSQQHRSDNVHILFLYSSGSKQWQDVSKNTNLSYLGRGNLLFTFFNLVYHLLFKLKFKFDYVYTSHAMITGLVGAFIRFRVVKKQYFVARESTSIFKRYSGYELFRFKISYYLGYGKVDLLICQTEFMKKQLIEGYPRITKKTRVEVIPNPIDLKIIIRDANNPPDFIPPENYIVSAGRLIPEKGFDLLIRAFQNISKTNSELKLLILGEGDERNRLENLAKELELTESVILPGRVNNVYPFFKLAKICIVSSRIEGFPNVLLQMMSQNENVITTRCAGNMNDIPNIIKIPTEDINELEKAMSNELKTNNTNNRKVFDDFLLERSIGFFIKKVNNYVTDNH